VQNDEKIGCYLPASLAGVQRKISIYERKGNQNETQKIFKVSFSKAAFFGNALDPGSCTGNHRNGFSAFHPPLFPRMSMYDEKQI